MDTVENKVIKAYREGIELKDMAESLNISNEEIKNILIDFKKLNSHKRRFTDEFKKVVAERDSNGISRRQISLELGINANTVKKACELFGQSQKEKLQQVNEFTKIDKISDSSVCPLCKSMKVNEVDINTIYCMSCGNEFILKKDHALKVNWEYLD